MPRYTHPLLTLRGVEALAHAETFGIPVLVDGYPCDDAAEARHRFEHDAAPVAVVDRWRPLRSTSPEDPVPVWFVCLGQTDHGQYFDTEAEAEAVAAQLTREDWAATVEEAMHGAVRAAQDAIGVTDGGMAGRWFPDGSTQWEDLRAVVEAYLRAEVLDLADSYRLGHPVSYDPPHLAPPPASFVCDCPEDGRALYLVTGHAGDLCLCAYCEACAELAAVDWNGETRSIVALADGGA